MTGEGAGDEECLGYDTGVISGAILYLRGEFRPGPTATVGTGAIGRLLPS